MGIVMPIALPLAWQSAALSAVALSAGSLGAGAEVHLLYGTVASVLGGAVWGDHCSPISDTTILSSLSSGCDHIEHVRTQLPYAGSVGALALALTIVPVGLGLPVWVGLGLGVVAVAALPFVAGRRATPELSGS